MSGSQYFQPSQVTPPSAPLGGGMGTSPLAAAILGRPSNFQLPQTTGGLSAPLMSMLMQQQAQNRGPGSTPVLDGLSNWLQGYQWNGMPGQSQMDALNAQAGANIPGMGPGGVAQTDPYGSMGAIGAFGNGVI